MTSRTDRLVEGFDRFLRAWLAPPPAARPLPGRELRPRDLPASDRRHAAGLMRVNHVGEVCAQALYAGQAGATRSAPLRDLLDEAAREEGDHLAWTATRLAELHARPSLLNPVWYAGSYAMGWLAGRAGDAISLGFVVETERQVEEHLAGHLDTLPASDVASRAIVEAMRDDERAHGQSAQDAGAAPLPAPVRAAMRGVARIMTTTAYWV